MWSKVVACGGALECHCPECDSIESRCGHVRSLFVVRVAINETRDCSLKVGMGR
jgi:hypothetical protein